MTKTKIFTALFLGFGTFLFMSGTVHAATITVDTTADNTTVDATCTLREAIINSNDNAATHADCTAGSGTDTIAFSVSGTISPSSLLPTITDTVIVDGETAPGASCSSAIVPSLPSATTAPHTPTVRIDNTGAGTGSVITLGAGAASSTVRGLNLVGASDSGAADGSGIFVLGANGGSNVIECNYLGTNLAGTAASPNANFGVLVDTTGSPDNIIRNNLISGNISGGVGIAGASSIDNEITGNLIGTNASGTSSVGNVHGIVLTFSSTSTLIRGNLISGNDTYGISIDFFFGDSDDNEVFGNFIGTDITGTAAVPNSLGIRIYGDDNLIGSSTPADRNLISGNSSLGVYIDEGTGNAIANNYIGVDITGSSPLGNLADGIRSTALGPNSIGGPTSAYRNVISSNVDDGIQLDSGGFSSDVTVQYNYIGISADGLIPMGNGQRGMEMSFADLGGNIIRNNVISANGEYGTAQAGFGSVGNTYQGNYIGTNALGEIQSGFGNVTGGIRISCGGPHLIGGSDPAEANIIAGNGAGVVIDPLGGFCSNPTVNILGNSIYSNEGNPLTGLGIDLVSADDSNYGPNPNDGSDGDIGPNEQLNYIDATSATNADGTQTVNFDLDVPDGDYRVEFFASDSADPSGYGEGQEFMHGETISHPGTGVESYSVTFDNPDTNRLLTTTVTEDLGGGSFGGTSEFSNAYPAVFGAPPVDEDLADTGSSVAIQLLGITMFIVAGTMSLVVAKEKFKV